MQPRKEHPKPQFMRSDWQNLNGYWSFEIDNPNSGFEKGFHQQGVSFSQQILVPFCPESKLSGIGNTDFMNAVWYKKIVNISKTDCLVRLHFGAADYHTKVYINGNPVGEHKGGYTSFCFDITDFISSGENEICVQCIDDVRSPMTPRGKQSHRYASRGCLYTRTTGIWQTVWLEYVPRNNIASVKYYPNIHDGSVTVKAALCGKGDFRFSVSYKDTPMGEYLADDVSGEITFTVPLREKHLWEVGHGRLYDVKITFGEDVVSSYFGLRQVRFEGLKFLLNERSVFQRLVLDQGYYPDGIYTAPTDEALRGDIVLSMNAGFNGARLHEKIFEERFLYYADQMGYLVWGEYPNWGLDHTDPMSIYAIMPEWMEAVERDFNHPSIIGWCPNNETWDINGHKQYDAAIENIYNLTKALDTTRPCIDTSGGFHVKTDVFCVHDYTQDGQEFYNKYQPLAEGGELFDRRVELNPAYQGRQQYKGEPCFLSEYGGICYQPDATGWGYGGRQNNPEEFYARFQGLTDVLLNHPKMFGLCYTQLTDVEQEQNGIYHYYRTCKFDVAPIRAILQKKAAIED